MNLLMKTELLEHQQKAFDKLKNHRILALFMEMGTGKTRTILEIIKHKYDNKKIGSVIYLCPASTIQNVKKEIVKHSNIEISIKYDERKFLTIASIEGISQSDNQYLYITQNIKENDFLIIDESSKIKNFTAMRTQRMIDISKKTKYKAILTGTPISNGLQDLYTQLQFLSPKILGYSSYYSFLSVHGDMRQYYDSYGNRKTALLQVNDILYPEIIAEKMQDFIYQVTSDECFELNKKNYLIYYTHLTKEQSDVYGEAKHSALMDMYSSFDFRNILSLMTKLQLIVSNSYNNKKIVEKDNKINTLDDILLTLQGKIIILFKYDVDAVNLSKHFGGLEVITGKTNFKKRAEIIKKFENENNILLANINCVAFGLNLQFAKNIIFFNSTYSLEKRAQAEKRIHRFGQTEDINIIDIIANNTIDIMINYAIEHKQNIVKSFRDEFDKVKNIKDDNIRNSKIKDLIGDM